MREEVKGEWKKLRNEELHDFPLTTSDDRNQEMGEACGTYGEEVHTGFWWRHQRKWGHLEALCVAGEIILK
jgi:1,2-phenylacetyl-CoA epoxidase catalytic subunit